MAKNGVLRVPSLKRIYLDHNATTPVDPRVIEVVVQELQSPSGNPSSLHHFGKLAKKKLTAARRVILDFFSLKEHEVLFTSGGTESMNLLIQGALEGKEGHVISSKMEHACVFETLKQQKGIELSYLNVGKEGCISIEELQKTIRKDTRLIVLSAANSETGVKNPLEEIARIALDSQIPLVVDGVGLLGKELFQIPEGVSGMGFSGHKIHAPQGTGFIVLHPSLSLSPLFYGGNQEYQKRPGTENLGGILGLAKAVELLREELPQAEHKMRSLRDHFEKTLEEQLALTIHGKKSLRLPNTSNVSFHGVGGEDVLMSLDLQGIAVSHGSACASGALEPSRVLLAMGVSFEEARSAIRFSLSRMTTREEIDRALFLIIPLVKKIQA